MTPPRLAPRPWPAPSAGVPVRGVAPAPGQLRPGGLAAAAAPLFAAALTAGTVLVRGWPRSAVDPVDVAVRTVLEAAGAYVVRSPAGLTVTSRSTAGELVGVDADLRGAPQLVPLALALAAAATTPSVLPVGAGGRGAVDAVRGLGARVEVAGGAVRVQPAPLRGGPWATGGDGHVALAGAVLGLVVPGVVLDDLGAAEAVLPGIDSWWLALLLADEHMLPGDDPHPGW